MLHATFAKAREYKIEILTVPITWKHVGWEKMSVGLTSLKMLLNLIALKIALKKKAIIKTGFVEIKRGGIVIVRNSPH